MKNKNGRAYRLTVILLRIMKHLDDREMDLTDQRIITAVQLGTGEFPKGLSIAAIAKLAGLSKVEVQDKLPPLIATRYIHEVVPTFGNNIVYKLGNVGQTVANALRRELDREEIPLPPTK